MSRPQPKRRPTNKLSQYLQDEENDIFVDLLGHNCYSLAAGVAQLLGATSRRQWEKLDVGVICFVKDYADKAYFLRLYDLNKRAYSFQQELYENFQVRSPSNHARFLTFEGDERVYGLNFAHEDEARSFKSSLDKCYEQQQKHRRRGSENMLDDNYSSAPSSGYGSAGVVSQPRNQSRPSQPQISSSNVVVPTSNPVAGDLFNSAGYKKNAPSRRPKGSKDTKKKKLTKSDIGLPTNFEHRVHVGWDPGKGLQSNSAWNDDLDPSIKQLLDKIGLNTPKLKQEDRKFIYEFVEQHGGMDQLKKELTQQHQPPPVPPPPPSRQPGTYRQHAAAPPPPPPPRDPVSSTRPLPPTPRTGPSPVAVPTPPPPPPGGGGYRPSDTPPPPPPPISSLPRPGAPPAPPPPAPPPPPSFGGPPPPPPPPPPGGGGPPPPPPATGGRADLLRQIQEGKSLRHVDQDSSPAPGREKLMDSIRMGVTLRETPKEVKQERITPPEQMAGIAGALARALAERRPQIESDESESESEDDEQEPDDDEWGD